MKKILIIILAVLCSTVIIFLIDRNNNLNYYKEFNDIKYLTVNTGTILNIQYGDKLSVKANNLVSKVKTSFEEDVLFVNISDFSVLAKENEELIITIPDGMEILNINTLNNINIDGINVTSLAINNTKENVSIVDSNFEDLKVYGDNSNINIIDVIANDAIINTNKGRIDYTGEVVSNLDIDNKDGDVNFCVVGSLDDYKIVNQTQSGTITINGKDEKKSSYGSGNSNVNIITTNGNINISNITSTKE